VCSAATAALPFLLELALQPAIHHRAELVELIARLAREAVLAAPQLVDSDWPEAWADAAPRTLPLLSDTEPTVRRQALFLLTVPALRPAEAAAWLGRRWREDPDPVTRRDVVLALGELLDRSSDPGDVRAGLRRLLDHDELQVRLAAVHALGQSEPQVAADRVATLVDAVRHPDADAWQASARIGGTRQTLVHATGRLLRDPVAAAAFAMGVNRSANPEQRIASLGQAGLLLAEWRTITEALLPFLADQLRDAHTEARYRAAFLLGCLGSAAAAHADRLAELTGDHSVRDSRSGTTVSDAAVWALARQHDPRCLSGLVSRLTGDRLGFGAYAAYGPPVTFVFWFHQPAIHDVLVPLREHAGDLVDAVVARITATADAVLVSLLSKVLAAWAPRAHRAVPVLLPMSSLPWASVMTRGLTALVRDLPEMNCCRLARLAVGRRTLTSVASISAVARTWSRWATTSARVRSRRPASMRQPRSASRGRISLTARVMVERSTPYQAASTSWVTPWRRQTSVTSKRSTKTS
jgi:hypothetical protein